MAADDWYRSPDWTPAAREEFERRLARARSGWAQYLRIKGVMLREAGQIPAARELWQRVLASTRKDADWEKPFVLELLADTYATEDPDRAVDYYRRMLDLRPDLNTTSGEGDIKLAGLLVKRRNPGDLADAEQLLSRRHPDDGLVSTQFKYQLVRLDLAEAAGDQTAAGNAARMALELANLGPVYRYHPEVGVVVADDATLDRLRQVARGGTLIAPRHREPPAEYRPLLADLAAAGIEVNDINHLYGDVERHPDGVPILLDHLGRNYPDQMLHWIGSCLQTKAVRPWWAELKALYLKTCNETVRDRIAAALSVVAIRQHYDDLLEFVDNKSLGDTRGFFLRPINRIGNRMSPGIGRSAIERLVTDPELTLEATAILKGRGVNE